MDATMTAPDDINWGQAVFVLASLIPAALLLPCWCVARFVWLPFKKKSVADTRTIVAEAVKKEAYALDIALDARAKNGGLVYNVLVQPLPASTVMMRYSPTIGAFEYWTDRDVSYKHLEGIARKYVAMFDCRSVYVDRRGELRKKVRQLENQIKENLAKIEKGEDKVAETKTEDSVFASLKTYRKGGGKESSLKTKLTRKDIVADIANKFIRRGKLDEMNVRRRAAVEPDAAKKELSFADWKASSAARVV